MEGRSCLDLSPTHANNDLMETTYDADVQALLDRAMTGKPLDPEVATRLREEGEKLRERLKTQHGLVDVAVPSIRELRGELP
jgi:hypothetical protein